MSTKKQIIDYVTHTPENVNVNVLSPMLDSLSGGAGNWSDLKDKPFESIGDGLKVENNILMANIPELPISKGAGEGSLQADSCIAEGAYSLAEGYNTLTRSDYSHAEGWATRTIIDNTDPDTHGHASHAEGSHTIAKGSSSHAEGNTTESNGWYSHAEGAGSLSGGIASHAEGNATVTNNFAEHAEGSYNKSNEGTLSSVGIGNSMSDRKNAWEIMQNGNAFLYGVGNYDGTNPDSATSLQDTINTKQNSLTAGDGIIIENNTIKVNEETFASVEYVDLSISDTMNFIIQERDNEYAGRVAGDNLLQANKQDKLTAGANIIIDSNNVISASTIPACPTEEDGTFMLKATVSNGEVTYIWIKE